jgi:hypothetical protein
MKYKVSNEIPAACLPSKTQEQILFTHLRGLAPFLIALLAALVFNFPTLRDRSKAGYMFTGDILGFYWPSLYKIQNLLAHGHFTAIFSLPPICFPSILSLSSTLCSRRSLKSTPPISNVSSPGPLPSISSSPLTSPSASLSAFSSGISGRRHWRASSSAAVSTSPVPSANLRISYAPERFLGLPMPPSASRNRPPKPRLSLPLCQ